MICLLCCFRYLPYPHLALTLTRRSQFKHLRVLIGLIDEEKGIVGDGIESHDGITDFCDGTDHGVVT